MLFSVLIYVFAALCVVFVFKFAKKYSMPIRIGLSIAVFVLIPIFINILVLGVIGDRAPPDAITIDQNDLKQ